MSERLVAIQVGAVSFVDEGVGPTLDIVQERGAVNTLFLATPTWERGTGGRQLPGFPLPDHGAQEYDLNWVGGNYATVHPEYYGGSILGAVGRAPDHPDWDIFAAVLPEARQRGMKGFAWIAEGGHLPTQSVRDYPNYQRVLEVDAWGRPSRRPCYNNPDYRNWHLSIIEDYAKSYDLDGIAWCAERPGPLNYLMQAPTPTELVTCFCPHCQAIARDRGIDVRRAIAGYRKAIEWNERVAAGHRSTDGAFVSFWRLLLQYPELLAWQTLWIDSQRQMYRDIYGIAKACKPEIQVGWHIYHNASFNPFFRADQDYAELSRCSDFIKVVTYNNCAGQRFQGWIANLCRSLFADASPAEVYPLLLKLLQLDEAPYEALPGTGFSADYVRRETARAVAAVERRCQIYSGIDIDIPVSPTLYAEWGLRRPDETPDEPPDIARCSRAGVKAAVLAAFAGGAQGVVLSRKYSEMTLDNLAGAGDAIRELGN